MHETLELARNDTGSWSILLGSRDTITSLLGIAAPDLELDARIIQHARPFTGSSQLWNGLVDPAWTSLQIEWVSKTYIACCTADPSFCLASIAPTKRAVAASSGKMPATLAIDLPVEPPQRIC